MCCARLIYLAVVAEVLDHAIVTTECVVRTRLLKEQVPVSIFEYLQGKAVDLIIIALVIEGRHLVKDEHRFGVDLQDRGPGIAGE